MSANKQDTLISIVYGPYTSFAACQQIPKNKSPLVSPRNGTNKAKVMREDRHHGDRKSVMCKICTS